MGYHIELNSLLVVPSGTLELGCLEVGKSYHITKNQERLYPLNIPIYICDKDYNYFGKISVRKLTLQTDKMTLDFDLLKIYSPDEAAIYTANFIKP